MKALRLLLLGMIPLLVGARWPDWAEEAVNRADLERFAKADAVVVLDEWDIKLKGGKRNGTRRVVVYVLTEDGRHAAVAALHSGTMGGYRNPRVWVHDPDGETRKYFEEDGSLWGISDVNALYDDQVLVIAPPGIGPGSQVALETRFYREPDVPQDLFEIQRDYPVARQVISVDARGGWKVLAHVAHGENPGPAEAGGEAVWEFVNVPRVSRSDVAFAPAPPSTTMALEYVSPDGDSPFADWGSTARWIDELFRYQSRDRTAIDAAIAELGAAPEDVVRSTGRRARGVRYYANELGWGSVIPRPPEKTLNRSLGDCKDKAQVMIALLREYGVDAYPVVVMAPEDGWVPDELPGPFHFNHAIVAVDWNGRPTTPAMTIVEHPDHGTLRFFDATLSDSSPEDISLHLQGGAALVVHPRTTALIRLPRTPAKDNVLEHRYDISIATDGRVHVAGEVRASGSMRNELAGRDADYPRDDELRAAVFDQAVNFLPDVLELTVTPLEEPAAGVWRYGYEVDSTRLLADFGAVKVLELGQLMPPDIFPLPEDGESSDTLYLPLEGSVRDVYEVAAADATALEFTPAIDVRNELGHVRLTTRIDGDTVHLERELGLSALEVTPDQRELVTTLRNALEQANAAAVVFEVANATERATAD